MRSHVIDELAAYAERQLDAADRARVERHLATCDACREALDRVRRGIALASELSGEPMPPEVAARIRARLDKGFTAPHAPPAGRVPGSPRVRWWHAAAATLVVGAGLALFWQVNRPWVRLHAASDAATRFEREGRALHDRIVAGTAPLSVASPDERALWDWLGSQGAPVTSMRAERTGEEREQFVPLGAAVQTLAGATASVLAYRIDGRPVTLALAHAGDVPDAPAAGWWTKRVMHRRDANGVNTLTWTVGGGTYVMVSELDGTGQRACLICHTAPAFIQRLRDLQP